MPIYTLQELVRLRKRHSDILATGTKNPEQHEKAIKQINAMIEARQDSARATNALPKKQLRSLGMLPPVGKYLCATCGDIAPDCVGWMNVNADNVGACLGCVNKARLANIEADARDNADLKKE